MEKQRQTLSDLLKEVLGAPFPDGKNHLYFEPPSNIQMAYPCIRYSYNNDQNDNADNVIYRHCKNYTITVIDRDPDSKIVDKVRNIPYCSMDRKYCVDDLNHFVFSLYFSGPRIKEEK